MKKLIVGPEASTPERNNFDALGLAMALLVVWSHSFALHRGSEDKEWVSLLLAGAFNADNLGVMACFVISGFLITGHPPLFHKPDYWCIRGGKDVRAELPSSQSPACFGCLCYNHGRRLKTLRGLTLYEYVARVWTEDPTRSKIDPYRYSSGLNT